MTVEQFRESLRHDDPPIGLDFALAGLWWDAKGDWTKAHEPPSRMKVRRDRGFMPICIARKAMSRMPGIGIGARAALFAAPRFKRNGCELRNPFSLVLEGLETRSGSAEIAFPRPITDGGDSNHTAMCEIPHLCKGAGRIEGRGLHFSQEVTRLRLYR